MQSKLRLKTLLVLFVFVRSVSGIKVKRDDARMDMLEMSPGTFVVGKMLLIPTLAALGMKFLALLPIFLAKIALLGVMNFIATNLNLGLTTIMNLKNIFKKSLWTSQNDVMLPSNYDFSPTLHPTFRYEYLLNRRSIKPDDKLPKLMRVLDDQTNFENIKSDKYRPFVDPYIDKFNHDSKPTDGNEEHLIYRRQQPVMKSGNYKCYWTDSSGHKDQLLRKEFDTNFYSKNMYLLNHPSGNVDMTSTEVSVIKAKTRAF